jgi:hypothetical protein
VPLARSPIARRTRLKSRIEPFPADVRKALAARSGGWCEAQLPGCLGTATDPCHRVGRAQGGADTVFNVWFGCRRCHEWCHARPAEACDLGLMLKSWQVPELEPMAYRDSGWVLLGDKPVEFGGAA